MFFSRRGARWARKPFVRGEGKPLITPPIPNPTHHAHTDAGSHLDLLVLTVHKLLVAGSERLGSLYHCFLTVLCNVSPYAKSLSLIASVKLLNLFELFTSPG